MIQGLPWGESPIDLPDEDPGELKFLASSLEDSDMLDHATSPQERAASWQMPGVRSGLGWTWGIVIVNTLGLLALNSHALANWANLQPVNPVTVPLVAMADAWHDQAGQWGLNTVVDKVEAAATAMRNATWPRR